MKLNQIANSKERRLDYLLNLKKIWYYLLYIRFSKKMENIYF